MRKIAYLPLLLILRLVGLEVKRQIAVERATVLARRQARKAEERAGRASAAAKRREVAAMRGDTPGRRAATLRRELRQQRLAPPLPAVQPARPSPLYAALNAGARSLPPDPLQDRGFQLFWRPHHLG